MRRLYLWVTAILLRYKSLTSKKFETFQRTIRFDDRKEIVGIVDNNNIFWWIVKFKEYDIIL